MNQIPERTPLEDGEVEDRLAFLIRSALVATADGGVDPDEAADLILELVPHGRVLRLRSDLHRLGRTIENKIDGGLRLFGGDQ